MDSTAILPPKLELLLVSDASSCPEIAAPGGEYRVAKLAEEAAEVSAGGREARVRSRNAQNVSRHFNPPVPNAIPNSDIE